MMPGIYDYCYIWSQNNIIHLTGTGSTSLISFNQHNATMVCLHLWPFPGPLVPPQLLISVSTLIGFCVQRLPARQKYLDFCALKNSLALFLWIYPLSHMLGMSHAPSNTRIMVSYHTVACITTIGPLHHPGEGVDYYHFFLGSKNLVLANN